MELEHSCLTGSNFGLKTKNVAIFYASLAERLSLLHLPARVLVMKFVAQRSAVWAAFRQQQLVDEHGNNLVSGRIIRHLDGHALVFRRIIDGYVQVPHSISDSPFRDVFASGTGLDIAAIPASHFRKSSIRKARLIYQIERQSSDFA